MKKPRRPHDLWWILDEEKNPVAVATAMEWAKWFEAASENGGDGRRVASTETATMWVSTVFLGTDTSYGRKGPPICFETMVFSREKYPREFEGKIRFSREDFDTVRYATWDDAEAGHNAIVRRVQKAEADALAGIGSSIKRVREKK